MTLAEAEHQLARDIDEIDQTFNLTSYEHEIAKKLLPRTVRVVHDDPFSNSEGANIVRVANWDTDLLSDLKIPYSNDSLGHIETLSGSRIPVLAEILTVNLMGQTIDAIFENRVITTSSVRFLVLAGGLAMAAVENTTGDLKYFFAEPESNEYTLVETQARFCASLDNLLSMSKRLNVRPMSTEQAEY